MFADEAAAAKAELERVKAKRQAAKKAEVERLRKHQADFTARPIVRLCVALIFELLLVERPHLRNMRIKVLDVMSGPGVWASEVLRYAQRNGLDVEITAVEIRGEELPYLRRFAHHIIHDKWQAAFDDGQVYHLVIGNPAFDEARAQVRPEWPIGSDVSPTGLPKATPEEKAIRRSLKAKARARILDRGYAGGGLEALTEAEAKYETGSSLVMMALLSGAYTALFTSLQCYSKTASGWLVAQELTPHAEARIPGSINFRKNGGADDKPYTVTCWRRVGEETPWWKTCQLPIIDGRSWKVRPGRESDDSLAQDGCPILEPLKLPPADED